MMNEFEFIETLKDFLPPTNDQLVGIGDDCAVIKKPGTDMALLVTTDMLAENVHFRKSWGRIRAIAYKSVAVNVSDIAAMGGVPQYLFWSLAIPKGDLHLLNELKEGVYEACRAFGLHLFGGNTCASDTGLILSHTLLGETQRFILRRGASVGDLVYCTGVIGNHGLALAILEGKKFDFSKEETDRLIHHYFHIQPKVQLARELAEKNLVSSMIDLSDGLFQDLGHILKASSVSAMIDESKIPRSDLLKRAGINPRQAAVSGEDYELLFTVPAHMAPAVEELGKEAVTCIGRIVSDSQALGVGKIMDLEGQEIVLEKKGFQHF